jgi:Na+/H+ antiporter NhaC
MTKEELHNLSDDKLQEKAKELKLSRITRAILIGLLAGVTIWGVAHQRYGVSLLIPLYFIVMLIRKDKKDKVLKEMLKELGLL